MDNCETNTFISGIANLPKMYLSEIEELLFNAGATCTCGKQLSMGSIECYDHTMGLSIKGFDNLQWIYFTCKYCYNILNIMKVINRTLVQIIKRKAT